MATERVQSCFEAAWETSLLLTEELVLSSALDSVTSRREFQDVSVPPILP